MNKMEDKIQEEIVRRALKLADLHEQDVMNRIQTETTVESLQELTGLPRDTLEKIAADVTAAYTEEEDEFLSIKNQIIITIIIIVAFCLFLIGMKIF